MVGKSDLAVSPADPDRLWVLMEAIEKPGLYRSDDAGDTFRFVSNQRGILAVDGISDEKEFEDVVKDYKELIKVSSNDAAMRHQGITAELKALSVVRGARLLSPLPALPRTSRGATLATGAGPSGAGPAAGARLISTPTSSLRLFARNNSVVVVFTSPMAVPLVLVATTLQH